MIIFVFSLTWHLLLLRHSLVLGEIDLKLRIVGEYNAIPCWLWERQRLPTYLFDRNFLVRDFRTCISHSEQIKERYMKYRFTLCRVTVSEQFLGWNQTYSKRRMSTTNAVDFRWTSKSEDDLEYGKIGITQLIFQNWRDSYNCWHLKLKDGANLKNRCENFILTRGERTAANLHAQAKHHRNRNRQVALSRIGNVEQIRLRFAYCSVVSNSQESPFR